MLITVIRFFAFSFLTFLSSGCLRLINTNVPASFIPHLALCVTSGEVRVVERGEAARWQMMWQGDGEMKCEGERWSVRDEVNVRDEVTGSQRWSDRMTERGSDRVTDEVTGWQVKWEGDRDEVTVWHEVTGWRMKWQGDRERKWLVERWSDRVTEMKWQCDRDEVTGWRWQLHNQNIVIVRVTEYCWDDQIKHACVGGKDEKWSQAGGLHVGKRLIDKPLKGQTTRWTVYRSAC
jgi:hypothetical protein